MSPEIRHNEKSPGGEDTPEDIKYNYPSIITVGHIRVDASRWWEVIVDGKTLRLTPVECKVLHFLAIHANTVCTSSQIISHVFGYSDSGGTILVKTYIRHLRQKIEPNPNHPIYILTVPDVGYTFVSHDLDEAMQVTSTDTDA